MKKFRRIRVERISSERPACGSEATSSGDRSGRIEVMSRNSCSSAADFSKTSLER
jgi:hypothetical protein